MEETGRFAEEIRSLLERENLEQVHRLLESAHAADVAAIFPHLEVQDKARVLRLLNPDQAGQVLTEMDDQSLLELVNSLDEAELSGILDLMPADNAAAVVSDLPEEQAERVLDLMAEEESEDVQELLRYKEDTAGRIMSPEFVAVNEEMSVGQSLEYIRKAASAEGMFYLYVVDSHDHLVGVIPLRRLITADPSTLVRMILQRDVVSVTPDTDQEEVARMVTKYNLLAIPVVSKEHRLLGTITVDDVIDVIHDEATEDIHRFAGVSEDETVLDPPQAVFTRRLVWRLVNLATAILAASVIGLFEESIQSLATLAIFMPIVASMGGIGTTQTATVVVRGIALGDMTASVLWRVLRKEILLGLTTGAANGVVMAAIAYIWKGRLLLSLILGVALTFNMLVAAVVGTLVPLALKAFRLDPAIASGVIIIAFTDVFGFFSFLGLATVLIRHLL